MQLYGLSDFSEALGLPKHNINYAWRHGFIPSGRVVARNRIWTGEELAQARQYFVRRQDAKTPKYTPA